MRRVRLIAGITIGLLVAASLVASYRQPSPVDIARRHCADRGVAAEKLSMLGHRGSRILVSAWETVEFQVKGTDPPRKLVVELRQPIYFLPWHIMHFREEPLARS
ncbi:MAG: hypothetical protein ACHRHE_16605 [Tepidisphaerales bacterium]